MVTVCVLYDVCLFCFFFFKQKTAYELRISCWSSDVCSSDLFGPWCQVGHVRRSFSAGERDVWVCCLEAADVESPLERKVAVRWLKIRGVRIFNVSVGLHTGIVRFGHPGQQLQVGERGGYCFDARLQRRDGRRVGKEEVGR